MSDGPPVFYDLDIVEDRAWPAARQPITIALAARRSLASGAQRLGLERPVDRLAASAEQLITARDGDQAWHGRLNERGALLRSGLVITLPPFAEGDVAGLVASLTGALPAPDLARIIAERSGGNPLLVTELARQLSRQGGDAAAARAAVPEPVRVITNARLAELSVPTRSVLKAAAVLGARFRRDVLGSVTGVHPGELADALATGRDARLLEPAGAGRARFRHEMVRNAVYDAIPEADREELHAQAGGVLAAEYARRAGDRAMAALAFEDVAHWYEHLAARPGRAPGRPRRPGGRRAQPQRDPACRRPAAPTAAGPGSGRQPNGPAAPGRPTCSPGRPWAWAALGLGGGPAGFEVQLLDGEQISLLEEARFALAEGGWPADRGAQAERAAAVTLIRP